MSTLLIVGLSLLGGGVIIAVLAEMYAYDDGPSFTVAVATVIFGAFVSIFGGLNTAWPHIYDSRTHWIGAETLATQACSERGGVRGTAADNGGVHGTTTGWQVTCNDSTVRYIPDGKEVKNR